MKRREFLGHSLTAAAALAAGTRRASAHVPVPRVAFTFDDFQFYEFTGFPEAARNDAILAALATHRIKAGAFVTGRYVQAPRMWRLVEAWSDAGHLIGNHTFTHPRYSTTSHAQFVRDVRQNEAHLRRLPQFRKWLRFPYLDEGGTAPQRDAMRAFLATSGYRNAHVTIDTSDWYIDERLRARLTKQPNADIAPYRAYYLDHIWDRAQFYDGLAQQVIGRSPPHVMLLHHNVVNATFLGDLLGLFTRKGWQLIDPREAYTDPLYTAAPKVTPAGHSLVWSLARETGRFDGVLRVPAEDGSYEKAKMDALGL